MTERTRRHGLRAAALAAAAMALAGCAADYVGDDWQCPLAQGSVCASVAAADPAIPATRAAETHGPETRAAETHGSRAPIATNRLGDAPPYRPRTEGAATVPSEEGNCASTCNPLAWLAALFAMSDGNAGSGEHVDDAPARPDIEPADTAAVDIPAPGTSGVAAADIATAEPATNGVPPSLPDSDDGTAAAAEAAPLPADENGPDDDLRAPETVARIWIAPWVDEDGIYREGSWVRAVIAPAEWRLR